MLGRVKKQDTLQRGVHREATKTCVAIEEDERETIEETRDNDEELQALCVCWKEAIMSSDKRLSSRRETKGEESQSLFTVECVENSQNSSSKKIIEVKDRWVKATSHHGLWSWQDTS